MELRFSGEVWYWRGPAPFFFVTVPPDVGAEIEDVSAAVTYGWGMIPVTATVGTTTWTTALWPKDGSYVVPLKAVVRRAEELDTGDVAVVRLHVDV